MYPKTYEKEENGTKYKHNSLKSYPCQYVPMLFIRRLNSYLICINLYVNNLPATSFTDSALSTISKVTPFGKKLLEDKISPKECKNSNIITKSPKNSFGIAQSTFVGTGNSCNKQ